MCTVSIVPTPDGCRVMCNRDERRTRAAARPPRTWPTEVSWATYPQDPVSGGHVDRRQRRRVGGGAAEPNGDCERAPLSAAQPRLDRAGAAGMPVDCPGRERLRRAGPQSIRAFQNRDGAPLDRRRCWAIGRTLQRSCFRSCGR
jgi:hypothetical protein